MLKTLSLSARTAIPSRIRCFIATRSPGVCFCLLVVLASSYISEHYGSSKILGALLLGMAFNSISGYREFAPGLEFCTRTILRFGVALLGARITFSQISELGMRPLWIGACVAVATLVVSLIVAKRFGISRICGLISGAAVAICGVSAAMAVASVLQGKESADKATENHLLCTLVGVTGISTVCMIVYPGLLMMLGLDPEQMGLFIGASIHDVAQVFGAGQMISPQVAELATYTKMLRVAFLIPLVMTLAIVYRSSGGGVSGSGEYRYVKIIPPFLLAFIGFVVLANTDVLSAPMVSGINELSQFCLWLAMAALGAKTNLVELWHLGKSPFLLLLVNTIFIAGLSLLLVI